MATLTIALAGSNIVNGSRAKTISNADVQLIINVMKHAPDGSTLTDAQAMAAMAEFMFASIRSYVTKTRRRAATASASASVIDVVLAD